MVSDLSKTPGDHLLVTAGTYLWHFGPNLRVCLLCLPWTSTVW